MDITNISGSMLRYYSLLLTEKKAAHIKKLWVIDKVDAPTVYLETIKVFPDLEVISYRFKRDRYLNYSPQGHVLVTAALLFEKNYDLSEWIRHPKKYETDEVTQKKYDALHENLPYF